MHLSVKTIESHRERIRHKLAIESTAELVRRDPVGRERPRRLTAGACIDCRWNCSKGPGLCNEWTLYEVGVVLGPGADRPHRHLYQDVAAGVRGVAGWSWAEHRARRPPYGGGEARFAPSPEAAAPSFSAAPVTSCRSRRPSSRGDAISITAFNASAARGMPKTMHESSSWHRV